MAFRWAWLVAVNPTSPKVIAQTHSFALCRVDTQVAHNGVFDANTATFLTKKADLLAVLAVKSALYVFYVSTQQKTLVLHLKIVLAHPVLEERIFQYLVVVLVQHYHLFLHKGFFNPLYIGR